MTIKTHGIYMAEDDGGGSGSAEVVTAEDKALVDSYVKAMGGEDAKAPTPAPSPAPTPTPAPAPDPAPTPKPAPEPERREVLPASLKTPKPADAPAEDSEVDKLGEPEIKDEKAKASFHTLRELAKANEKKAKAAEIRIKELESRTTISEHTQTEIDRLKTQNAEYSEIVSRARIEAHPEFRAKYIDGRKSLVNQAKSIIDDSGGDAKAVETALNLQGRPRIEALREVAGSLDQFSSGRLGRVIDQLDALDTEAAEKVANSQQSWEAMQREEQERAEAQRLDFTKNSLKAFDTTLASLRGELEVLNKADGADAAWWNDQVDKVIANSRAFFTTNRDAGAAAKASIMAQAAPVYRQLFQSSEAAFAKSQAELKAAKAELEAIYKKSPAAGGGSRTPTDTKDFMAQFQKAMGQ